MTTKGQATLDAARARRQNEKQARQAEKAETPDEKALTLVKTDLGEDADKITALMDPKSGYTKPRSLSALEHIVSTNGEKGFALWRKAADALMVIRAFKMWKNAPPADGGEAYASFADYAERRFGFKKTYAYDLVKAATKQPEALTEGAARAERKAASQAKPISADKATDLMQRAWEKFQDVTANQRDRAIDNETFVGAFDAVMRAMGDIWSAFIEDDRWLIVEDESSADAENEDDDDDGEDGEQE